MHTFYAEYFYHLGLSHTNKHRNKYWHFHFIYDFINAYESIMFYIFYTIHICIYIYIYKKRKFSEVEVHTKKSVNHKTSMKTNKIWNVWWKWLSICLCNAREFIFYIYYWNKLFMLVFLCSKVVIAHHVSIRAFTLFGDLRNFFRGQRNKFTYTHIHIHSFFDL